jgi:hypothetical protein
MIRDCFNKNNARNRDVLTQQKAMGKHIYLDDIQDVGNMGSIESLEDRIDMQLLEIIDENGNLIFNNLEVTKGSESGSGKSRNRRKKSN